ncbi:MAG TPA: efflux RND transporter permease subunit [Phenylobacterium sp.]|uniref:efflux RND transporter permease subunit n=1 Tax=Phenylobacterium sp. TaxID=1871053 RepID=UPI002D4C786A|nr:efflux RND transporter permease subunit [Phenylobacterium sp.]HZZ70141.1 efflux RND transporter permease subunit [Phenylobacterium sp.]
MNALVRIALARPYTFIVMSVLIMIFGIMAALTTPTDIFPDIKVPVIGVAFNYSGLSPEDMSDRIVTQFERFLTTTVNDVEHTESQSLPGIGVVKIFFQPGTDIRTATAQVTATAQTSIKQMPQGVNPPLILNYSAATVPILQLADSDKTLSEQKLFDLSQVVIRPEVTTVRGAATPYPYGGQIRQVQIDLNPEAMQSKGVSANDINNALAAQNQILPSGFAKIGSYQYNVRLNDAAATIDELNDLPVKTVGGATILMRDVAQVRDGSSPQTNIVHVDGGRAVLSTILKIGSASTLSVVQGVKDKLPALAEQLPSTFKITALNDQSLFVKGAISGVVREGAIAAALTSLMILLFLGSWRSTVIIAISIPLSVLAAIAALSVTGQTFNIMTLGGLALAVGILVDDATVTIENINWHLEHGKDVRTSILDGANQIVTPAFVSLLCICIVFVPMFLLKGVAGFLFVPMAMAVVYAMIASFILSRTLVPTMAMYLLRTHAEEMAASHGTRNPLTRFQRRFEAGFARVRSVYAGLLERAMGARRPFLLGFLAVVLLSFTLAPFLGSNFFPSVDAGQMTIHVRAPIGTRLEDTSLEFGRIENTVRNLIPPDELASLVDNIGLPNSSINTVYSNSGVIGPEDGDLYVSLKPHHHPTADYVKKLREVLPRDYPGTTFAFLPADIVSQILNFGSPAPIDLQIAGPNADANRIYANSLMRQMRGIRGLADMRMQQPEGGPELRVNIDRVRAAQQGLAERDVTNSLLGTLAGSGQVAPTYWVNPQNGVSYPIVAQTPEFRVHSLASLEDVPINNSSGGPAQILGGLGSITRGSTPAVVTHYNALPVIDIYATTQDRDLGAVTRDINKVLKDNAKGRPRGATVTLRGQMVTMDDAFSGLFFGIVAAIVLIYLLIVVNFQSWLDPFVIITALPAALAGIVWMLFATGTTLSVPALTGAIMCMGVATANSILVISFARERLAATGDAVRAATEAGFTRFRPVVMTALAMVIGMTPMALGLGEGGEQNAPLGRAVIGGLIFATVATLMFVPVVFSLVHGRRPAHAPLPTAIPVPGESYA